MYMDAKLIVIIAFGVLALAMCFLSGFYTRTDRVKSFIAVKGLATLSYLALAVVSTNLLYITYAYATFIILGLSLFMFSSIVRAIPTRSDMFHAFYTLFESIAFGAFVASVFFLFSKPFYGLIGGIVTFLTLMTIYLIKHKEDAKKDKLTNLLLFLCASTYLGITFNFVIVSFSATSLLLTFSSTFALMYVILQNFTSFSNKKTSIIKNVFLGVALIITALAVYFI